MAWRANMAAVAIDRWPLCNDLRFNRIAAIGALSSQTIADGDQYCVGWFQPQSRSREIQSLWAILGHRAKAFLIDPGRVETAESAPAGIAAIAAPLVKSDGGLIVSLDALAVVENDPPVGAGKKCTALTAALIEYHGTRKVPPDTAPVRQRKS